jgi:hypothetical protein
VLSSSGGRALFIVARGDRGSAARSTAARRFRRARGVGVTTHIYKLLNNLSWKIISFNKFDLANF